MALPKYDNRPQNMTEAEYIAWEAQQEARYEFVNGDIVMMSGGSLEHAAISMNVGGELRNQLKGSPCRVLSESMRVKVAQSHRYPDVSVVCGEPHLTDDNPPSLLNPTLLVEVLSESTEAKDKGIKLRKYTAIASLQYYMVVSQHDPIVELFTQSDDSWWYQVYEGIEQQVHLTAIDYVLNLTDVYDSIEFGDDSEAD